MVILRLRIDQFGKLKDYHMDPDAGLNVIYGKNESGKSTIAEFIRAALYGMPPTSRANMIRDNERVRYLPHDANQMGGSVDISHNGKFYTINANFGKRKGEDRLELTNSITGEKIDTDGLTPGEFLTGLSAQAFSKMNYIKQLSTSIKADKDDDILRMLVNLSQTGDEKTSYKLARTLLEEAEREIAFRGKGKLPGARDQLAKLYNEKTETEQHTTRLSKDERELIELECLKKELENTKIDTTMLNLYREKFLGWQAERKHNEFRSNLERTTRERRLGDLKARRSVLVRRQRGAVAILIVSLMFCLCASMNILFILFALPFSGGLWLFLRAGGERGYIYREMRNLEKESLHAPSKIEQGASDWFMENLGVGDFSEIPSAIERYEADINAEHEKNMQEVIALTENIANIKNDLRSCPLRPVEIIEQEIADASERVSAYETNLQDLKAAEEALEEAFYDLQMEFGPKLARASAAVLKKVTLGKYRSLKVDENYNIVLVDEKRREIKGEYLSTGAYDQIYFALRMGIIDLLAEDLPIIMDDSLTQYDNERKAAVMQYLRKRKGQLLMFTCVDEDMATINLS